MQCRNQRFNDFFFLNDSFYIWLLLLTLANFWNQIDSNNCHLFLDYSGPLSLWTVINVQYSNIVLHLLFRFSFPALDIKLSLLLSTSLLLTTRLYFAPSNLLCPGKTDNIVCLKFLFWLPQSLLFYLPFFLVFCSLPVSCWILESCNDYNGLLWVIWVTLHSF